MLIGTMNGLEFAMGPCEHAKWLIRCHLADVVHVEKDEKERPKRVIPPNYTRSEWREKQRTLRRIQMR